MLVKTEQTSVRLDALPDGYNWREFINLVFSRDEVYGSREEVIDAFGFLRGTHKLHVEPQRYGFSWGTIKFIEEPS